jgi:hypothetical protein
MNVIDYMAKEAAALVVREKQAGLGGTIAKHVGEAALPVAGGVAGGLIGGNIGEDIGDAVNVATGFTPGGFVMNNAMDMVGLGSSNEDLHERQRFGGGTGAWSSYGRPLLSMVGHPVGTAWNGLRSLMPGTSNSMWGGNNRDVYEAQHGRAVTGRDKSWYWKNGLEAPGAETGSGPQQGEKAPWHYQGPPTMPQRSPAPQAPAPRTPTPAPAAQPPAPMKPPPSLPGAPKM